MPSKKRTREVLIIGLLYDRQLHQLWFVNILLKHFRYMFKKILIFFRGQIIALWQAG